MDAPEMNQTAPPTLNHVVGQKRAVEILKIALEAHFNQRATVSGDLAMGHILMAGPAGTGKSMLSELVALELGVQMHSELAQNLVKPEQVQGLMMMAAAGDVVFVDELHETPPSCQTTLYRCLEERKLFLGGNRKSITLPPFCFIGATTDTWSLTKSLRDRFRIHLTLTHYSEDELVQLVGQRAKRLGWAMADDAVQAIAARGRGVPRLALRLLEAARRFWMSKTDNGPVITLDHVLETCRVEGVDTVGLDTNERLYLELLREAQGPLRLNIIASQMSLPRRTVERCIEADLIRLGLVTKSDAGRMLTAAGIAHLNAPAQQPVSGT